MDTVDIDLVYEGETDSAIRFTDDDDNTVWLPKSQIDVALPNNPRSGLVVSVAMPEWLAEEKGLI
jgi:hypothetical protein